MTSELVLPQGGGISTCRVNSPWSVDTPQATIFPRIIVHRHQYRARARAHLKQFRILTAVKGKRNRKIYNLEQHFVQPPGPFASRAAGIPSREGVADARVWHFAAETSSGLTYGTEHLFLNQPAEDFLSTHNSASTVREISPSAIHASRISRPWDR